MLSLLADPLLALFYPQHCGSCGRLVESAADGAACRACWNATRIFDPSDPLCPKCGTPLSSDAKRAISSCGQCDEFYFDAAFSSGLYHKALAATILALKKVPSVSKTVDRLLIDAFGRISPTSEFSVVPVPLSKQRLHERGFNQATLLARRIAGHSGAPIDEFSLIRKRDTPFHRAAMDKKARAASVRNVFAVVRPNLIRGRKIILVDDLMTSGSTASNCAKVLKQSGAGQVIVMTLARAL
ncbi:MAG: ComF family protein [Acidobacteria bacterium]|nr:ComF family protein [Acidobacteriota bacterium]